MFQEILKFEFKTALKRPMVYIFTIINFALSFGATVSDNVQIAGANDAINVNAPHVIMTMSLLMTLIGVFMTTAFMNSSILKDFEHNFDGLIFSTPITKKGYLGGRFLSAFVLSLIPFLGVLLGIALGGWSGLVDAGDVSAFQLTHYLNVFMTGVIPNVFLISAVVFVFASLFKSHLYTFVGALGLVILYSIMGSLVSDIDNELIAVLSDPLGINSYNVLTKYWTIDERNSSMLGFSGLWLVNRAIWFLISVVVIAFTFSRFSFTAKRSKHSKRKEKKNAFDLEINVKHNEIPVAQTSDSLINQWIQYLHQSSMEIKGMLRSTPFIVVTIFSILNMYGGLSSIDESYGTGNHPVTYLMVDAIRGTLYIFLIALIMYYSGALIWKERDVKMNELFDASPLPTWVPYLSKMTALLTITGITLCLGILCGVLIQLVGGYTHLQLGVYARELLVYDFLMFGGLIALAMCIQTIVNNKYIGYFAFLLSIIALSFGPQALEISSNMVAYGSIPDYVYSDMNEWSVYENGLTWFSTYWTLVAGLVSILGLLFWVRGMEGKIGQRLSQVRSRFNGKLAITTICIGVLWLGTSSFLFYQTKLINEITNSSERETLRVLYEKKYKKYEHIPQPRITAIDYKIDIFPEERNFTSSATVTIKNKTEKPIRNIHFTLQDDYKVEIQIENARPMEIDSILNYQIHELETAMMPGEERMVGVVSQYTSIGIENEVSNTEIVQNGSFLNNFAFMPTIGYSSFNELSDNDDRKENGLDKKDRSAKLHQGCSASCQNSYISQDSDWVYVSSTISTAKDQIAIAPGSLVKSWEEGERSYYSYKVEEKVLNFYSFISGKYEIARDIWTSDSGQKVDVEVYYHKGHEYNVDKMILSLKNSLDYFTKHFTDYPHKQARIIEFPRYDSFAQAFPGTMPYSESIGFIANLQEENAIDMVYYVVAHEMAHQWWAHQVIGADVQGATMLSETFAQYSALMVMKKQYGEDKMKQFMRYEMDAYLRGRARENEKELPLMYNESQSYIHYGKGSVVMYALQNYIGEDKINAALKAFAVDKSYQEPPYTNTLDFMSYLREVTPDSLQYLIHDMVESITLYSNRTIDASYKKIESDKYEVTINVEVEKYSADSLGRETSIALDDYIEIGVFSSEIPEGEMYGRPLLVKKVKVTERKNSFTMIVDEEPFEAGIDPNYLLVDRMPGDNVKRLIEK